MKIYIYNLFQIQLLASKKIKQHGSINNSQCQGLMQISRITATRELKILIDANILIQEGIIGRGTKYKLK
jgi:predicted HTH transcriptional regulator